ncbi:MAG TPA: hypothetical protein VGM96_22465 [Reyranella sp.]|jgi:hypothetical protein
MRQVGILLAAIVLAGTVSACADPYYYGPRRTYAYTSDAYYPRYYAPAPVYYSSRPYSPYYASPYYSRSDYYRNYNGIHAPNELNQM